MVKGKRTAKKAAPKKSVKKSAPKKSPAPKSLIGEEVEFRYPRVKEKVVIGTLQEDDGQWLTVVLTKEITGLVNIWKKGEIRRFRKEWIESDIKSR